MMKDYKRFIKFICALCCVLFLCNDANAQKEANIWYFGDKAGIDFNGSVPVALTDGEMYAFEGCASIADANGNLLFYTDGVLVWNKNHLKMPNGTGLMGHTSSTQSAVIVPQPGNDSIYYLFTVAYRGGPYGFRYSRVNMNLVGGLGDVETSTKNTPILTPVTEKITATRHANGRDVWVIVHGWGNNNFYTYLVTDTGFVTTPVVSSTGLIHEGNLNNTHGQLKVSIDGSKIAICIMGIHKTQLFDFNISTGTVSNPITLPYHYWNYGCEFSPDMSKLYLSLIGNLKLIYQYDISSNDSTTMVNTGILIKSLNSVEHGSLQLAPDGKIYIANTDHFYLSCIEKPNEVGLACDFKLNGFDLSGRSCRLGLPNFISYYMHNAKFKARNFCLNDETCFNYTGKGLYDSLVWDFGDGLGSKTTFKDSICHMYLKPGGFEVTLIIWYNGVSESVKKEINIYNTPAIYLNPIDDKCNLGKGSVAGIVFSGKSPFAYSWNNGSTDSVIYNLKSGTYSLTVIDSNGCLSADTTKVVNLNIGCNLLLYVPNAFSPNGDGSNDVFKIFNQHHSKINVQIFNRWGEEIFRSTDVNFAWDGTYKGQFCPDGIYTVIIHYETHLESGKTYLYKGNLHLLR